MLEVEGWDFVVRVLLVRGHTNVPQEAGTKGTNGQQTRVTRDTKGK